ncbi:MAG: hypothetical protein ACMVY4_10745 [Minwuia sp.]|uniref:hypothetical protein n=1 Tax=Minwuia sp. TaxID=2493630 RepID=UPI003A84DB5F
MVRVAMRAETFALSLDAAANESSAMPAVRRRIVAGESWDDRAAEVETMLRRLEGRAAPLRIAAAAA